MPFKGDTLMRCPDCGKKGVSVRLARGGHDWHGCRYCMWSAYVGGYDTTDVFERFRLVKANPGTEAVILDEVEESILADLRADPPEWLAGRIPPEWLNCQQTKEQG